MINKYVWFILYPNENKVCNLAKTQSTGQGSQIEERESKFGGVCVA